MDEGEDDNTKDAKKNDGCVCEKKKTTTNIVVMRGFPTKRRW